MGLYYLFFCCFIGCFGSFQGGCVAFEGVLLKIQILLCSTSLFLMFWLEGLYPSGLPCKSLQSSGTPLGLGLIHKLTDFIPYQGMCLHVPNAKGKKRQLKPDRKSRKVFVYRVKTLDLIV